MPRISKRWTLLAMLLVIAATLLVVVSSALAYPGLTSWTEKQAVAGLTQRTIYGECQVFLYKLPKSVSHIGYLHAELVYKPGDYDCYVYLIDANGNICAGTEPQGYWGSWAGKEIVDFYVPRITNNKLNEYGTDVIGDTYYVMVQAFDDVSNFQISGYYPRTDVESGTSTTGTYNWYRAKFRYPESKTSWKRIYGAPYGTPYDFRPTSVGSAWMQLRYPFDMATKQAKPEFLDPTKMAANFDQYMYPQDWSEDGALWDYDWTGATHWLQTSVFGDLPPVPLAGTYTRGLSFEFDIAEGAPKAPHKTLHYIPVLWQASKDATLGKAALKTGMSTVGYRADLAYPQNMYMKKPASSVKAGSKVEIKGTLAIDPAWIGQTTGAGTIAWAPSGQKVTVQRQYSGGSWKNVGTTTTGTNGAWSVKVTIKKKAKVRAVWTGTAMKNIAVSAQKTPDGATKAEPSFTAYLNTVGQSVWGDASVDLVVKAIDATAGVTLGTVFDTAAVYTVGGAPFVSPWYTLKSGSAPLEVTMGDKTKVKVSFVELNKFSEKSINRTINVK